MPWNAVISTLDYWNFLFPNRSMAFVYSVCTITSLPFCVAIVARHLTRSCPSYPVLLFLPWHASVSITRAHRSLPRHLLWRALLLPFAHCARVRHHRGGDGRNAVCEGLCRLGRARRTDWLYRHHRLGLCVWHGVGLCAASHFGRHDGSGASAGNSVPQFFSPARFPFRVFRLTVHPFTGFTSCLCASLLHRALPA